MGKVNEENEEELDEKMTPGGHTDKKQDAPKYSTKSDQKKMEDDKGMLPEEEDEDEDDDDEVDPEDNDDDDEDEDEMDESNDLLSDLQNRLSEMNEDELQELSNLINDPIESSVASISKLNKEDTKIDVSKSIDELVQNDETLSEEFKKKASTLFEAAVSEKIETEIERLNEEQEERVRKEIMEKYDQIVEKVDTYLNYVIESWIEENDESITNKLRTQISESFIESLKNVFEEHYIEMPESKIDIYEEVASKANELEEKAETQANTIEILSEKVSALQREKILREATEDLYDTQADRLRKLVNNVEFESPEDFQEKVQIVRESYLGKDQNDDNGTSERKTVTEKREIRIEDDDEGNIDDNSAMGIYIKALESQLK